MHRGEVKINDNNDFSNYLNSCELWKWEDRVYLSKVYNNTF